MHRLQQTQELAEAVFLSGERFATLAGVGTDLATAGNGVARARRTVVCFFFFIRVTTITLHPSPLQDVHPVAASLIITLFPCFLF
jgi:hypothetical protein